MTDIAQHLAPTTTIPRLLRDKALLPSLSQQRLWFASQVGESGLEFIFPYALRLRGPLDYEAMRRAINALVRRHEALRTNFVAREGEPFQVVREEFDIPLQLEVIEDANEARLNAAIKRCVDIPFKLDVDLMLRAHLFQIRSDDHVLLLAAHHIATDGWSMDVFFRELGLVYDAFCQGREPELPDLPVQFVDYAAWERAAAERGDFDAQMEYWRNHLRDAPLVLSLPLDRPRPTVQTFEGAWVKFSLSPALVSSIDALAHARRATRFQVLLAGYQTVLARWQSRNDIIIGTPVANRPLPETESLVGFFINLLPLRCCIDENETFSSLLDRTRSIVVDGFDNMQLSFDRLVMELSPERTLAHNPLLQTTIAQESNLPVQLQGLHVEFVEARPDVSRYDIAFDYWPDPVNAGGLCFDAYYASDLFERSSVEALVERFRHFMVIGCTQPELPLFRIPSTTPSEEAAQLALGRGLATSDEHQGFLAHFLMQVQLTPDSIAIECGERHFTFAEIASIAAHTRALLSEVKAENVVAVCLPSCGEWVGILIGVMCSGAAYLALDPKCSRERLAQMLSDSNACAIVTTSSIRNLFSNCDTRLEILSEDLLSCVRRAPIALNPEMPLSDQLACLVYPVDATGKLRGVAMTHRSLDGLFFALKPVEAMSPSFSPEGWCASPLFGPSFSQWIKVAHGGKLVVLSEQIGAPVSPGSPGAAGRLDGSSLAGDNTDSALVISEVIAGTIMRRPTNGGLYKRDLPLNANVYVLDSMRRVVPVNVEGELYVGGHSLARGYFGLPGLTARCFVPNPFADRPGEPSRLYRTGSRARWKGDGWLELVDTCDRKVEMQAIPVSANARDAVGEVRSMTSIERAIASIWIEILETPAVGLDDNFFLLGGHSLLVIRMIARVKREMQLTVSMTLIFQKPVLRDFAASIEQIIRDKLVADVEH